MAISNLQRVAREFIAAHREYSSWINDPESHGKTYREPGAGYFRQAEQESQLWEDAYRKVSDQEKKPFQAVWEQAHEDAK